MKSPKVVAVAALAMFAMAACGASTTTPTGAGTPTGAATQAAATPAPAATGGTTTPASTSGAVDQCALLTAADLKTVTGADFGAGALNSLGQCVWNADNGSVVGWVSTGDLTTLRSGNPGSVDVTVSAYAGITGAREGTLSQYIYVDVDGRMLALEVGLSGAADPQALAQKLAEIAVGNM